MRHDNEDMILAGYQFIRDDEYRTQLELGERDRYMMAVADGMGGHLSGEVASSDVLHNLQFFFSDLPVGLNASSFNEMIVGWLESINMILDSKGKADEQYKGMGTTLVALAYYDGDFYSMNCGDSRLYRLRNEELVQLTTDHSLSSLMGDQKHSSVITNCIGGGCTSSYIDVVHIVDIQDGDTYLLCSDGLTDMMSDNRLSILLAEGADANDLCNAAIVRGGFDNVSACLIKVKKE
ncbi:MAG: serine/threonine-protein phosphatase [Prevotella sp.]|nr:serine/threonine-protein phosphatase [Prevotella sp.]